MALTFLNVLARNDIVQQMAVNCVLFFPNIQCSVSCGVGTQFRNVICQHQNGTRMPEGYCMQEQRPGSIRTCNDECATSPPSCEDKKSYCHIVAKYNLCSLYMDVCCASCSAV